jgi:hypothetical protein
VFEDDGRLLVYAGCSAGNAKAVAEIVRDQLALLAAHGPYRALWDTFMGSHDG